MKATLLQHVNEVFITLLGLGVFVLIIGLFTTTGFIIGSGVGMIFSGVAGKLDIDYAIKHKKIIDK